MQEKLEKIYFVKKVGREWTGENFSTSFRMFFKKLASELCRKLVLDPNLL